MTPTPAKAHGLRALLTWPRLRTTAIACAIVSTPFSFTWEPPLPSLWLQVFGIGLGLLLVFGVFEQWPRRLPGWLRRCWSSLPTRCAPRPARRRK